MRSLLHWIDRVNAAHPWSHNDHYIRSILRQLAIHRRPGARAAVSAPTAPARQTLREIRAAAPGAVVRRRLFWRYTLVEEAAPN